MSKKKPTTDPLQRELEDWVHTIDSTFYQLNPHLIKNQNNITKHEKATLNGVLTPGRKKTNRRSRIGATNGMQKTDK